MNGMRTVKIGSKRVVHAVRASAETDAVEWLMDGTAARGVVTIVAQETNDAIDALCASLDYAVRLASGVPKKIVSEEPETKGAIAELRVGRPCRVVCGIPLDDADCVAECAMLAIKLAEKIGTSQELLKTNLSVRACCTERDFERMVTHARKFRADAIVIITPSRTEIEMSELVERLEAVARSENIAVVTVESFSTEVFNDLLREWGLTNGA